ncbi:MAG: tail fiber domain-containing protein [Bacteroidales bacterium]|nr:tail fiber domain-containing protein [Bacteroidales bacterium]
MKTKLLLFLIVVNLSYLSSLSQIPQGVNYQAIARDAFGDPIPSVSLQVRFTLLTDTLPEIIVWQELHSQVQTNPYGLFSIVLGNGSREAASQVATFGDIDWSVPSMFLRTWVYYQSQWHLMGTSRLWSVPYAVSAGDLSGAVKKLEVAGETALPDEALFEVKNKNGQTVFAVYSEGVRIYVGDGVSKASKGGFAIGSFDESKVVRDYFVVNSDCVRVYIDNNPAKAVKGGFAIGSFDASKAATEEYLRVTNDSTRIYVSESSKAVKGGFAIGSFDQSKGPVTNFVNLNPRNYLIGQEAGGKLTSGLYNNIIGFEAGYSTETGGYNTFLGYQAGKQNLDGNGNVFIGYLSGEKNTWGSGNVFLGMSSGQDFAGGYNNTYIGTNAGQNFIGGSGNIFIGRNAGTGANFPPATIPGTENILLGNYAAFYLTSGLNNVMLGNSSGFFTTSGYDNLFSGSRSGYGNTIGYENVFVGSQAGYSNTSGDQNVFVGIRTGYFNQTGRRNTFVGAGSGYSLSSGEGNVFLGAGAGASASAVSNRLFIHNSGADFTNALIYGEFDVKHLRFNSNVTINRQYFPGYGLIVGHLAGQSPTYQALWVYGDAFATGNFVSGSDLRWKKNITQIENVLPGLLNLKAVSYDWKTEEYPDMDFSSRRQIGLIAQDVEKLFPLLVTENHEGYKLVDYQKLSVLLLEAIHEQQSKIEKQTEELNLLRARLEHIEAVVLIPAQK